MNCSTAPSAYLSTGYCDGAPAMDGSYDLPSGVLNSFGALTTTDIFYVDQTPNSLPQTLRLSVRVTASGHSAGCGFTISVSNRAPQQDGYVLPDLGPPYWMETTIDSTYTVEFTVAEKDSFKLTCDLDGGSNLYGNGYAAMGLSYVFVNTPPGLRLHSCQGYRLDTTTPAIKSTWGALKARYR